MAVNHEGGHGSQLVEVLTPYAVYDRRSHKMTQTQNTRVLSGERRGGGGKLCGESSGGGSHWREWKGGVLSGMRAKAMAVSWAGKENSETVAKC